MRIFKAYFKKEMIESWRQFRYLILGVGFVFFAIFDPILLKILPTLLKSQIPAEMLPLMKFNSEQAIANYMKDIYQLGNLFVILTLMGIISDEINTQKLVFPYSKGARAKGVVLAKFFHYAVLILILSLVGFSINAYYVNILFEGAKINYGYITNSSLLFTVYYIFAVSLLFFLSSVIKSGMVAGILVLLFNYIQPLFSNIGYLARWFPHTLIVQANQMGNMNTGLVSETVVIVALYVIVLQFMTIYRLKKVEVI